MHIQSKGFNHITKSLFILFFLSIFPFQGIKAQFNTFSFESDNGFLWPHRKVLSALQKGHYHSYEFRMGQKLYTKPWHKKFRFPEIGLAYSFQDPGYPEVLGYAHALSAYARIPLYISEKSSVMYRLHAGLGYLTEKFDADNNYYNLAIGSNLNIYARLSLEHQIRIYENFLFKYGFSLTHFSNTSYSKPNLGINLVSFDLGIDYELPKFKLPDHFMSWGYKSERYWEINYIGAFSAKEITPPGERKYLTHSSMFNFERRISSIHQLGIGYDLFFDGSLPTLMSNYDRTTSGFVDYLRSGIHVLYGLRYNKVLFMIQVGSYIFSDFLPEGPIYNRLGLRIYPTERWIINITLKSHYGRADFAEFGVGYVLFSK